jgi:hypothetical protein
MSDDQHHATKAELEIFLKAIDHIKQALHEPRTSSDGKIALVTVERDALNTFVGMADRMMAEVELLAKTRGDLDISKVRFALNNILEKLEPFATERRNRGQ